MRAETQQVKCSTCGHSRGMHDIYPRYECYQHGCECLGFVSANVMPSVATSNPLECAKCGYEWTPRKPAEQIRECPNCKSRKWR